MAVIESILWRLVWVRHRFFPVFDCFLKISFRLFVNYMHCISPNEPSNIFQIIMSEVPVYEAVLLNSQVISMSQVREPTWDYTILKCSSFIPRNCEAEFSQLFTRNIFNPHMHEIFPQLYCMKRVPGDPQKEMLN